MCGCNMIIKELGMTLKSQIVKGEVNVFHLIFMWFMVQLFELSIQFHELPRHTVDMSV